MIGIGVGPNLGQHLILSVTHFLIIWMTHSTNMVVTFMRGKTIITILEDIKVYLMEREKLREDKILLHNWKTLC